MELLEQCQRWHENGEYRKIIDTLEAIPEDGRSPELDMALARAYINLADPEGAEGRRMLRRAISLMKRHKEELGSDYSWNFRMGYAHYYLDQEGPALNYFNKALERHPGDAPQINTRSVIEDFIQDCRERLSLPRFTESFLERTRKAWEAFASKEAGLRNLMDQDRDHERGDELVAMCNEILQLAFDDVSFELGFNGEKHELILTPEGDRVKLLQLIYFRCFAPASVLEHWSILVGRQPAKNMGLRFGDWEISGDDVQIWIEQQEEDGLGLAAYCEKLRHAPGADVNQIWWMLVTLTDQILGEIPHMRYIDSFDVLDAPREEPPILLTELSGKLEEMGLDLSIAPEEVLELYTSYQMKPDEGPNPDWRMDVIAGSTGCVPILNEYLSGEEDYMDSLHADGIVPGFLCYPIDGFKGENRSQEIFEFRDRLESALTQKAGPYALTLTGGATGIYNGYVDFVAWDLPTVLAVARIFFEESGLPWAVFHTFRRSAMPVPLVDRVTQDAPSQPQAPPFEGFDFTGFWDDSAYALKEYVSAPPSDELIADIEEELGYKLPASYIWLMRQHNGGIPANTCFPTDVPTSWAEDHVAITGIFGIGRDRMYSLCGELGSQFMIDEWEYPPIGVAVCDCPSGGHDMIFLDYRDCGPQGEPKVVHVDQECDYEITPLADTFEDFIRGLVGEEIFGPDPEEEKEEALEMVREAPFSPLLRELCQKSGDPAAMEGWIRDIAARIVEEKGYFALHADEKSWLLYDIQFWLYENAHPGVAEQEYLEQAYPKIIALAGGFSTGGYAPGFVSDWLKSRKKEGVIGKQNGRLYMSEAKKAELDKIRHFS